MIEGSRSALLMAVAILFALLVAPTVALAQSPAPEAGSPVRLTAEPLLGGAVRQATWVGVRVLVENDGPAISGELRLSGSTQGGSTYSLPVELAPGARQEHFLYAPLSPVGNRLAVSLISGPTQHARVDVRLNPLGASERGIFVVAERPELLVGAIRESLGAGRSAEFASLLPEGLPRHAEAWSSIDVLVWHDLEPARLDAAQLESLRTWAVMGGDLVILGGSTGLAGVAGFPADLLPYQPTGIVDVSAADLATLLGSAPAGVVDTPALAGPLERGTLIGGSADSAIAARATYGSGSVTLIGFNPIAEGLAEGTQATALWQLALPAGSAVSEPRLPEDDGFLLQALGDLPAVQLPRTDHLMLLILGYIVAIGPINYLLLKRRDRREWAWLTMPLIMGGFALATFGFGVALRGSSVVVNELVIVHGATGTDRGLADVHVGVFSPSRAAFELSVSGDALISAPTPSDMFEMPGQARPRPLDVVLGDPARLRDFGVGFGALRAFRAHAMVVTPRVDAELRLEGDVLVGTVTNASDVALSDVAVVYAGGGDVLGDLGPGESRPVSVRPQPGFGWSNSLSQRLYPVAGADAEQARIVAARRALVQHLNGGWEEGFGRRSGLLLPGPVVLASVSGGVLDVDVGGDAEHVGQTLYVLPTQAAISGDVVFSGGSLEQVDYETDSGEGFFDPDFGYHLTRGTLTADYRPVGFQGSFRVSAMTIRLGFGRDTAPGRGDEQLAPLPADEQPDSDAPLASTPRRDEGVPNVPRVQLFDHATRSWVEFEPLDQGRSYLVADPARYVDQRGAFRIRFVMRTSEYAEFGLGVRLEGSVE